MKQIQSRDIKFRVWNSKTKTWVHGPGKEVNLFGELILFGEFMNKSDVNECEALQFTGLLDSDGKEIYEGDIIKEIWQEQVIFSYNSDEWVNKKDFFAVKYKAPQFVFPIRGYSERIDIQNHTRKIITNIYESPDFFITEIVGL